jgi:hypothetical protein
MTQQPSTTTTPTKTKRPDQNHQKRPDAQPMNFKARTSQTRQHRSTHLCITIRWPAAAGQTGHVKLILKPFVPRRRTRRWVVGGC